MVIEDMHEELPEKRQGRSGCRASHGVAAGQHLSLATWNVQDQGSVPHLDRRAGTQQMQRYKGANVLIEVKQGGARDHKVTCREYGSHFKDEIHYKSVLGSPLKERLGTRGMMRSWASGRAVAKSCRR